jgi:hypothetical protein
MLRLTRNWCWFICCLLTRFSLWWLSFDYNASRRKQWIPVPLKMCHIANRQKQAVTAYMWGWMIPMFYRFSYCFLSAPFSSRGRCSNTSRMINSCYVWCSAMWIA